MNPDRRKEKFFSGPIDRDLLWLTGGCVLPAGLALLAGLWREGQVPSLLLLDAFDLQFVTQDVPAAFVMILVGLFCFWFSARNSIENQKALLERCFQLRWLVAGVLFLFCTMASLNVYRMAAVSGDEYANVLQTRIFASFLKSGDFYGQWPADLAALMLAPELANRILVSPEGRLITSYQPVFSMFAAPFELAGVRFLLNPLIAAGVLLMSTACVWRMTRIRWVAGLAVLMVAGSASVVGFGMSSFATNQILFFHLVFLWFVLVGLDVDAAWSRFACGAGAALAGGLALHTGNQVPHILAAGPVIAWLFWQRQVAIVAGMGVVYLPLIYAFSISWTQVVHSISMAHRENASASPGATSMAGAELGWLAAHLKWPTARQFAQDCMSVLRFVMWASPGLCSLFLVKRAAPADLTGARNPSAASSLSPLLIVSALAAAAFYFFFPLNQGHGWGYRYLHPVLGFLMVAGLARWVAIDGEGKLVAWMILSSMISIVVLVPFRTSQISSFVADRQALLPCLPDNDRQICFVDTSRIYWGPDLIQNRPFVSLSQGLVAPLILRSSGSQPDDEAIVRKHWPSARRVEGWNSPGAGSVWVLPQD